MKQFSTKTTEACLSDLALDRIVANGISLDGTALAHLEGCPRCKAILAEREQAKKTFAANYDIHTLSAHAIEAASKPMRHDFGWRLAIGLLPIAAAVLVVFFVRPHPNSEVLIKGGTSLRVISARDNLTRALRDGDEVRAGDRLRFIVDSSSAAWVSVWGRDERGAVWRGAPQSAEAMVSVAPKSHHVLDGTVAIDAAGSHEEIFLFACAENRTLTELENAMKGSARPELDRCTVQRFLLMKP
jgi:hypothetical protein